MTQKALTTRHIAEYCQVTQRTVVQWISEERLKSFRTLGKHIRVKREDFIDFLNQNRMPVPEELRSQNFSPLKKILIVDDDPGMVDAIERILAQSKQFLLESATDGFSAGKKFVVFSPDLVILDLNMPGVNGYELCASIREESQNDRVKILAISGTAQHKDVEKVIKLGADAYLQKPFQNSQLMEALARLFGWTRRTSDGEGAKG